MTIIFNTIKRENIFTEKFNNLTSNNRIDFPKQGIAIIYGPNGIGKTSLAKVLNCDSSCEFSLQYDGVEYNNQSDNLFHVIDDQMGRNIIKGSTKEFFLGDDIRKEYDLKEYLNVEFNKLFEGNLSNVLKNEYGISKKGSKLLEQIPDEKLGKFISHLANTRDKGKSIDRNEFVEYINSLSPVKLPKYDEETLNFLINDFEKKSSVIKEVLSLKNDEIVKNDYVSRVEEHNEAIRILSKYSYINECIVCGTEIDPKDLLLKKEEGKKKIYRAMDEKTKKIIEGIVAEIGTNDPFGIKEKLVKALSEGDYEYVESLKGEIEFYFKLYNLMIHNYFSQCLDGSEISEKLGEYNRLKKSQPELTEEDILYIEQIVNENIDKKIELKRDEDNNLKLVMDDKEFLNKDRKELNLSNGEQNFISLSFELLKAKNSDKEIIVLDDPISSFDSIYKNKIAFAIIKFLENKKQIILTHNTDLVKLMEHQKPESFNLYIFNNTVGEENGFIRFTFKEQKILLYIDELINLFRNGIKEDIENEKIYLMSMVPFMRGYAKIIGYVDEKQELTKLMHGYYDEEVDVAGIYNSLFKGENQINGKYSFTAQDISEIDLDGLRILKEDTEYPLLNRTLEHTLTYLYLRLNVEKVLVDKYKKVNPKRHTMLSQIIFNTFNSDDLQSKKNRVFLASRKTLLNEFNHFEGNMNIFQPAIDITDTALKKEKEDIINFLNSL